MSLSDIRERPSPNHDERRLPPEAPRGAMWRINMIVLHYTGMGSAAAALDRLCDPMAKVSAHYVVDEDGTIWRLVPEARRAWHAGVSCWAGEGDINSVSVGIEIVNPGHQWGYREFPEPQMEAVEELCRDIQRRCTVPPDRIVGHSDVAPERKTDPGELFDWPRLARSGVGVWPEPAAAQVERRGRGVGVIERARALSDLARIGYCVGPGTETVALVAFQRRFRPARWDGLLDAETAARLAQVRAAYDAVRKR